MRTLPKNISWTHEGYLVRVVRGKVRYQAFVSHRHADALERAVAARDRFDLLLGVRVMADYVPEAMARVLDAVKAERTCHRELWMANKIPFTCDTEDIALGDKLAVLAEEVGEVAKEVNDANGSLRPHECLTRLRTELIQVAAVAVAWAESLPTE